MTETITLTADALLIEQARERARREQTSLDRAFQRWLRRYAAGHDVAAGRRYQALMEDLSHIHADPPYPRDELNKRR